MIKLENTVDPSPEQWKAIIRGMRNPMNSWDKSDSEICKGADGFEDCTINAKCPRHEDFNYDVFCLGNADHELMMKLSQAGSDHAKFRRMIPVCVDIVAPLYWWKEFDTYKVGTVANSCSTMHKIHAKEFTLDDFSCEHLTSYGIEVLETAIEALNDAREAFLNFDKYFSAGKLVSAITCKEDLWWEMIQLLPSSYNQRRTVFLNYEVLANIYKARRNHKLTEWHTFCGWIEELPYSEIITGDKENA